MSVEHFLYGVRVTSVVAWGSVLGPFLFSVYVYDMPKSLGSHLNMFVDDATVMREVRNDEGCSNLQRNFDKFQSWFDIWLMTVHLSRCTVIKLGQ